MIDVTIYKDPFDNPEISEWLFKNNIPESYAFTYLEDNETPITEYSFNNEHDATLFALMWI